MSIPRGLQEGEIIQVEWRPSTLQESSSHVRSKRNRQPLAQRGPVFAEDGSIKRRHYGDASGTNGDPSDARQTEEVLTLLHREPRYTTVNAEVSQGAEDGNGSERFPVEVFHCNILPRTLYMLVPVVIEGTQQLLTLAVHENQASGAAIQVQSVAVPVVTSAPGHIEGSAAPSSATSREPNRTVRSDMWRRLADTERLETLKRMDQDPRFMSICAELWEMYQTTTG
ncbi:hypothetical protein PC116_g14239 [Phytophthora cactorum]|uniref:Uncharacterized protein n=1 Tax=Phytophthora cactorum TaxID=29920 RepID=A0A8T1KRF0_9STRA|nr:hypothetical protein Pcac1_g28607 [Phytophthora cactorum]KAG2830469.1 hypothetical protein PC112_g7662 [Phytophthora cactorum]KAG2891542.1 hypothetical protein PC114_g16967 [Phytophthora cactorum]KAG2931505.1 hypothetical protein PC117_g13451 [Phytophthora cactorum]KAG4050827.1 hypothetical protein PC123_g13944 [Phytophthora cactorum]